MCFYHLDCRFAFLLSSSFKFCSFNRLHYIQIEDCLSKLFSCIQKLYNNLCTKEYSIVLFNTSKQAMSKEMLDKAYDTQLEIARTMMGQTKENTDLALDAWKRYIPKMYTPEEVKKQATAKNLHLHLVDGSNSAEEIADLVEKQFLTYLRSE